MNIGIVLAGGIGSRFGNKTPKQYQLLCGKEVISYSISALKDNEAVDQVIIVAADNQIAQLKEKYEAIYVEGGSSRNESLFNALNHIKNNYECEKVIILEAARPMITCQIVSKYLEKLDEYDGVITGQHITDSLGAYKMHVVDRSEYYLVQAPEAFIFEKLFNNFDKNSKITATSQQLSKECRVYVNFEFEDNYKITYHNDLAYCEDIIRRRNNEKI